MLCTAVMQREGRQSEIVNSKAMVPKGDALQATYIKRERRAKRGICRAKA